MLHNLVVTQLRLKRRRPGDDAADDPYLQWVVHSVMLTAEDADGICEMAKDELGIEPLFASSGYRSEFTFPVKLRDVEPDEVYRMQRVMRRITAEVLIHNEPAFERVEQIAVQFRYGDTGAGPTGDPR